MTYPWPTTPIQRCKKRFKPECDPNQSFLISEDKENINPEWDERELHDTQMLTDKNVIPDNENQMIDLENQSDKRYLGLNLKNVRSRTAEMTDDFPFDRGEEVTSFTKNYNSDNHPSPMWPAIEVEQLATWLKRLAQSEQTERVNSSSREHTPRYEDSADSSPYESPSSSSSDSPSPQSSDGENKRIPRLDETLIRTQRRSKKSSSRSPVAYDCLNSIKDSIDHTPRQNRMIIVDCRYPYEYDGGHIIGAINLAEWPKLRHFLFGRTNKECMSEDQTFEPQEQEKQPRVSRTIFILHCEFSSHRAPRMFQLLRDHDRLVHLTHYPTLRYPKVYVLRGGYAAFYARYPELCVPSAYLKMHSRPDLLSQWHRHCSIVNRKDADYYSARKPNSHKLSIVKNIPLFTVINFSPPFAS
ncbi:unnamed protein product [Echinostoma caproni]|uniref:Rhodanese domain-containing protein n=1 Tax=Echinostoma caproni TaxID=27848 RepID=A0A183AR70_9TREM|nr:unnamed protein product [Echinostoma caproni]